MHTRTFVVCTMSGNISPYLSKTKEKRKHSHVPKMLRGYIGQMENFLFGLFKPFKLQERLLSHWISTIKT